MYCIRCEFEGDYNNYYEDVVIVDSEIHAKEIVNVLEKTITICREKFELVSKLYDSYTPVYYKLEPDRINPPKWPKGGKKVASNILKNEIAAVNEYNRLIMDEYYANYPEEHCERFLEMCMRQYADNELELLVMKLVNDNNFIGFDYIEIPFGDNITAMDVVKLTQKKG